MSNIHGVAAQGQSIWMDEISRRLLEPEGLAALVEGSAVTGVTSNPTIFANAIVGSADYDDALRELVGRDADANTATLQYPDPAAPDGFRLHGKTSVTRVTLSNRSGGTPGAPTASFRSKSPPCWPTKPRQPSRKPATGGSGSTDPTFSSKYRPPRRVSRPSGS